MKTLEIILEEKYPKKLGMGPTAKKIFQEMTNADISEISKKAEKIADNVVII